MGKRRSVVRAAVVISFLLGLAGLTVQGAEAAVNTGDTSNYSPALVVCPDSIHGNPAVDVGWVAFTGTDHHIHLIRFQDMDSSSYAGYTTSQTASSAPSLACEPLSGGATALMAAWRVNDGTNRIAYGQLIGKGSGYDLSGNVFSDTSQAAPSIAQTQGGFAIAWAGTDSQHHINILRTSSAGFVKTTTSEYTRSGAGVSIVDASGPSGTHYYLTWLAASGTPYIFVGYFGGGSSLSAVRTGDYSAQAPIFDSGNFNANATSPVLWLSWLGYTNQHFYTGGFDGSTNLGGSPDSGTGIVPPATYTYAFTDYTDCHNALIDTSQHLVIDLNVDETTCPWF